MKNRKKINTERTGKNEGRPGKGQKAKRGSRGKQTETERNQKRKQGAGGKRAEGNRETEKTGKKR